MFGLGGMEVGLIAMFFGLGLPLGIPPEKENPALAYAAPAECLLYVSWAGMAAPNPSSPNQTEQLLAEPEVRAFAAAIEKSFTETMQALHKDAADPAQAARMTKLAPLWARTVLTRPAAFFVSKFVPDGNDVTIEAGLILQADAAAEPLAAALTEMLTTENDKPVAATIAGRPFMKLAGQAGGDPPFDIVWGANNGYLMIGFGAGAIEGLSTRLAAKQEPAWLTKLKTNLPIQRRSTVAYFNVKQALDTFVPLGGPQAEAFVNSLGLRQITSFQSATGLDETGVVSRSLLAFDGPPKGLLTLADSRGLTAADLKHIPADALVASTFSLDSRQLLEVILNAITEVDPNAGASASDGLTQLAQQTGIDVRSALAALGTRWSLHAAQADGSWLGAALTVEVKDRPQVQQALDRILANAGPRVEVVRTPYAGQTIQHLVPPAMELAFLRPAWCLSDKQLAFGLNPQAVKSVLGRQTTEKSLADLPAVASRLTGAEAVLAISYYDTPKLFEGTYMSAQILLPMAAAALQKEGLPVNFDASQLPAARTVGKHLRPTVGTLRRTKLGVESETRQTLPGANVGASTPIAVALLLPAIQAARASAARSQGMMNLRQQMLALHNYHDTHGRFPAAYSTDKDGKPLLSWRVAILPFIEEQQLYNEFHLDEPWDSEHNKKLIPRMPKILRAKGSKAGEGLTTYLGVGGKQGVLGAPADPKGAAPQGIRFAQVTDGTSNTLAIVEASDEAAVSWTKPEEWVPNEKDPFKGLIGLQPNGFNGALCDGSVRFLSKNVPAETLKLLFMMNDGQPINLPD